MRVRGSSILDILGIPLYFQAEMTLPLVPRQIELVAAEIAEQLRLMMQFRRLTLETLTLCDQEIDFLIARARQYMIDIPMMRDPIIATCIRAEIEPIFKHLEAVLPTYALPEVSDELTAQRQEQ